METKKLMELHTENKEWLGMLAFYKEDLKIIEKRIAEIASKNSSKDVLAQVEHFQNQFIIQRNNIDELKHEINVGEEAVMANIKANPVASDHRKKEDHTDTRDKVLTLEKIINELRHEANRFCAKWM